MINNKRLLIIAAHPDDEIIGCAGTAARLISGGVEAFSLVLGEGVTSRDDSRDIHKREDELLDLKKQMVAANKVLGIKEVFSENLPDNRFDAVPLLDIVKIVEKKISEIKPDIIFTHYSSDLNIDHRVTYKSVITATRPLYDQVVKEIYSFEVLSSTEWGFPVSFNPDVFVDITNYFTLKLKSMDQYTTELREFPHPRSLKGISINAEYWGMRFGVKYIEAFKTIRRFCS